MVNWKKRTPSQVYIRDFVNRYRAENVNFFTGIFQGFCW